MKIFKIFFAAIFLSLVVACGQKQSAEAKLETVTLDIKGMTCEVGCAKTIESKISKVEGVTESKVNFEKALGTFTYDANKTSAKDLTGKINGLLDGKTYTASLTEKTY